MFLLNMVELTARALTGLRGGGGLNHNFAVIEIAKRSQGYARAHVQDMASCLLATLADFAAGLGFIDESRDRLSEGDDEPREEMRRWRAPGTGTPVSHGAQRR